MRYVNKPYRLHVGDCIEVVQSYPDNYFDSLVCDPPYGLEFMGKTWDKLDTEDEKEISRWLAMQLWHQRWAEQVIRVVKPGSYILAFGGTRTFHRLACAMEDAGFEIRDVLAWMYGQGFPKSLDVSKEIDKRKGRKREVVGTKSIAYPDSDTWGIPNKSGKKGQKKTTCYQTGFREIVPASLEAALWEGWGTALKPAYEPIILARKPLIGTVVTNILEHGTGAINIDGCRIYTDWKNDPTARGWQGGNTADTFDGGICPIHPASVPGHKRVAQPNPGGRWPANLILSHDDRCLPGACAENCPVRLLDEQSGIQKAGTAVQRNRDGGIKQVYGTYMKPPLEDVSYGDKGGASRFFYCPKPSRKERDAGCEELPDHTGGELTNRKEGSAGLKNPRAGAGRTSGGRNLHPTVKSVALMRWLCRLVTPPGGLILDPFAGSGSTGCGALQEGFRFVGIEREPSYAEIAYARLAHWSRRS